MLIGQSLDIRLASMSSSDSQKQFQAIGNHESGKLVILDQEGGLFLYDGYELEKWSNQKIANTSFIKSIAVQDSHLYALTDEALFVFKQNESKPQVVNKSFDHYLFWNDGKLIYASDSEFFSLKKQQKTTLENDNFPIKQYNYSIDNLGELFYLYKDQIIWSKNESETIATKSLANPIQILVDFWNNKWILENRKLHKLITNRFQENANHFKFENNFPSLYQTTSSKEIYAYYSNGSFLKWNKNNYVKLPPSGLQIKQIFIDELDGLWAISKSNTLQYWNGDKWLEWADGLTGIKDDIITILRSKNIVSIVLENDGIIQTRVKEDDSEWVFIDHRINRELQNLGVLSGKWLDKIYLFTGNFGIYTVHNNELSIIKKDFPSFGIIASKIDNNKAAVLDKGQRFHIFNFEDKSISRLEFEKFPPVISSNTFEFINNQIIYQSGRELVIIDINDSSFEIIPFSGDFTKSILHNNSICEISRSGSIYVLPTKKLADLPPKVEKVLLKTNQDITYEIFPEKIDLSFISTDFPIEINVIANYISDPKGIEYAWKSTNKNLNRDFQFKSKFIIQSETDFDNWSCIVKYGDSQNEISLPKIKLVVLEKAKDYRWAIYLSAILGIGLITSFIFYRWRSSRQKQRIFKLEMEKKTIELEQKALQLQLNPHFIFNALNGVKGMIAVGEDKKARQYLTKVSSWMRNMLNDSRADKITIAKEVENLGHYLEIEQELRDNSWTFAINIPENIDQQMMIPPMMIQPFVENCIVHAFNGLTQSGHISINFKQSGRKLHVLIEDNGKGLEKPISKDHESIAMKLIQERLKILNQGTSLESFSITDRKTIDTNLNGVVVKLLLPII